MERVYHDVLHRPPSPGEAASGLQNLNDGVSREQLASVLLSSPEYQTKQLVALDVTLLGRPPSPRELQAERLLLRYGVSLRQLEGLVLGSPEYLLRAGARHEGFLEALFKDELHRSLDPSSRKIYRNLLASGSSRTHMALSVLGSVEAESDRVRSFFQRFLHRPADDLSLGHLVGELRDGVSEEQIIAQLLGSQEYYNLNGGTPASFVTSLYAQLLNRQPAASETATAVVAMMRFISSPFQAAVNRYPCTITNSSVTAVKAMWDSPSRFLPKVASAPSRTKPRPAAPRISSPGHQKRASAKSSAMPVAYMNCRG